MATEIQGSSATGRTLVVVPTSKRSSTNPGLGDSKDSKGSRRRAKDRESGLVTRIAGRHIFMLRRPPPLDRVLQFDTSDSHPFGEVLDAKADIAATVKHRIGHELVSEKYGDMHLGSQHEQYALQRKRPSEQENSPHRPVTQGRVRTRLVQWRRLATILIVMPMITAPNSRRSTRVATRHGVWLAR